MGITLMIIVVSILVCCWLGSSSIFVLAGGQILCCRSCQIGCGLRRPIICFMNLLRLLLKCKISNNFIVALRQQVAISSCFLPNLTPTSIYKHLNRISCNCQNLRFIPSGLSIDLTATFSRNHQVGKGKRHLIIRPIIIGHRYSRNYSIQI